MLSAILTENGAERAVQEQIILILGRCQPIMNVALTLAQEAESV